MNSKPCPNYVFAGKLRKRSFTAIKEVKPLTSVSSMKGKNIVPTDLTVRERLRHNPNENIDEKKDLEKEIKDDFNFLKRGGLL